MPYITAADYAKLQAEGRLTIVNVSAPVVNMPGEQCSCTHALIGKRVKLTLAGGTAWTGTITQIDNQFVHMNGVCFAIAQILSIDTDKSRIGK